MFLKPTPVFFAFAWLAMAGAGAAETKPASTLEAISEGVICQCGGCNHPLKSCPHVNCSAKAEMENQIQKGLAEGKDEKSVVQALVLQYGVKVLATPPAQGFNLTVWILPALAFLLGLAIVVFFVRRWRRISPQPAGAPTAPVDSKVLKAMEDEMKNVVG